MPADLVERGGGLTFPLAAFVELFDPGARRRPTTGKERSKSTFKLERDAKAYGVAQEHAKATGTYVGPDRQLTVGPYARQWFDVRSYGYKSARSMAARIARIERSPLGRIKLMNLTPSHVQAWIKSMQEEGLAPRTISLNVGTLKAILNTAVADRLLPFAPMSRITLPRIDEKKITFLTIDQVNQLANAVPPRFRAMVLTQAGLGLRISELLALRVHDVNWLTGEVRIDYQLGENGDRIAPKYGSRRTLHAGRQVLDALRAHIEQYPPLPDGTLFYRAARQGREAGPMTRYYGDRLGVYADRIADVDPPFPRGVRSHWLRHHYASVSTAGTRF